MLQLNGRQSAVKAVKSKVELTIGSKVTSFCVVYCCIRRVVNYSFFSIQSKTPLTIAAQFIDEGFLAVVDALLVAVCRCRFVQSGREDNECCVCFVQSSARTCFFSNGQIPLTSLKLL